MKRVKDIPKIMNYLKYYEVFNYFSSDIINKMDIFEYSKGELVCCKDTELTHIFFLVKGKLKTYNLYDNGKSLLLKFNSPLSIFGDIELFTNKKINCNVEAITTSQLIAIEVGAIRKFSETNPDFLKLLIQYISEKLYQMSNSASLNLLYSLETRLASYLLSIQSASNNKKCFRIPKSIELAQLLGTSYRHFNRTLKYMINNKIIEKDKKVITILNQDKLEELSQGNIYEK